MKTTTTIPLILLMLAPLLTWQCRGTAKGDTPLTGDTLTHEARLLTLVDCGDYVVADVADPWNEDAMLGRYILVIRGSQPDSLPEGTVVEVPLNSSLVYSSVHAGAIGELGAIDRVTAVCDAPYFKLLAIVEGLRSGKVVDAGASASPSIETIIGHRPGAILLSPFQNAGHGAIEQLGIPIIECADYMEETPLGRAEWIKLLGILYGNRELADSIYAGVKDRYTRLADSVNHVRMMMPVVLSERVTDGVWYVPGGRSYQARMFADAGGNYPWRADRTAGSLQLDFPTVYDKAHMADVWLIRTYGNDLTLDQLKADYSPNSHIKAFNNGGVYSCNTSESPLFEEFPFHPDLLLREYINIFYPGYLENDSLRYYKRVQ
ncbi:MAG: ABC transporter substrate-binding protein [Pseudoflavonifractor sp.]|nr:ABC transporter substrate-binding protein [Pseudoflavonifractor sp.]